MRGHERWLDDLDHLRAATDVDGQLGALDDTGRGHKVTKAETADYCERVLRGYVERREDGESFAAYVARADEAWLL